MINGCRLFILSQRIVVLYKCIYGETGDTGLKGWLFECVFQMICIMRIEQRMKKGYIRFLIYVIIKSGYGHPNQVDVHWEEFNNSSMYLFWTIWSIWLMKWIYCHFSRLFFREFFLTIFWWDWQFELFSCLSFSMIAIANFGISYLCYIKLKIKIKN